MSDFDQSKFLASYFDVTLDDGQNKAASAAEPAQDPEITLFIKVASEAGFDLNAMDEAQTQALWDRYQADRAKLAADEEKKEEKSEKKDDKGPPPKEEHEESEKKARALVDSIQKTASPENDPVLQEGGRLGQAAAYSYVGTLQKIAAEGGFRFLGIEPQQPESEEEKVANKIKEMAGKAVSAVKGYHTGAVKQIHEGATNARAGHTMTKSDVRGLPNKMIQHFGKNIRREGVKDVAKGVAKFAPHAAAVGAAGAAAAHGHKKEGSAEALSAFNLEAAKLAFELIKQAGHDESVAQAQLQSILNLEHALTDPSEKIASTQNYEEAVQARALEFAELAGYQTE